MSEQPDHEYWFPFNINDWTGDADLRLCSAAARGVWLEAILLMQRAEPKGYLRTPSGRSITAADLSRLTGLALDIVEQGLAELLEHGVYSVTGDGTPYCRRIVRESERMASRSDHARRAADARWNHAQNAQAVPKPCPSRARVMQQTSRDSCGSNEAGDAEPMPDRCKNMPPEPEPEPEPEKRRMSRNRATPSPSPSPEALKLASQWAKRAPAPEADRGKLVDSWARGLDKLAKTHPWTELEALTTWVGEHDFWSKNCRSPLKLLKRDPDGLPYVDRLLAEMESETARQRRKVPALCP